MITEKQECFTTMALNSGKDARVIYKGINGFQQDRDFADTVLTLGEEYLVESVSVGTSSSIVKLQGIPGRFNTVLFANATEEYPKTDWFVNGYTTVEQIRSWLNVGEIPIHPDYKG